MAAPHLLDESYQPAGRIFIRRDRPSAARMEAARRELAEAEASGDARAIRTKRNRLTQMEHLHERMHGAWDINAPEGTPVHVPLPAHVLFVGQIDGMGNTVILVHEAPPPTVAAGSRRPPPDGAEGDTSADPLTTAYCHLQGFATGLAAGQTIAEDQVLGYVGGTTAGPGGGTGGTRTGMGVHLHFSVHRVSVHPDRRYEDSFQDAIGRFARWVNGRDVTRSAAADIARRDGAGWRPTRGASGGFGSGFEEDWRRYVEPDVWLGELHIGIGRRLSRGGGDAAPPAAEEGE